MYITAATLAAIWCAAELTAPRRAMNSAMNVNAVTSTRNVRPIGMPSASEVALVAHARPRPVREHADSARRRATSRTRSTRAMQMIQYTIAVDSAQPGAPSAGAPAWPNTSTHVSGTLSARPIRLSPIITRGSDTAVV